MARRLDDKIEKLIVADRINGETIRSLAFKYNTSTATVQRVLKENKGNIAQTVTQKEEENTQSVLEYMDSQRETKKRIIDKLLLAIEKKAETVDMFTSVKDLATAYGILLDKEFKAKEIELANNGDGSAAINEGLIAIADLIKNPRPNRELPEEPAIEAVET